MKKQKTLEDLGYILKDENEDKIVYDNYFFKEITIFKGNNIKYLVGCNPDNIIDTKTHLAIHQKLKELACEKMGIDNSVYLKFEELYDGMAYYDSVLKQDCLIKTVYINCCIEICYCNKMIDNDIIEQCIIYEENRFIRK